MVLKLSEIYIHMRYSIGSADGRPSAKASSARKTELSGKDVPVIVNRVLNNGERSLLRLS